MRVVVLITDGMPTVENKSSPNVFVYDTGPTEAAAKKLRDANVVMFVAYVGNANQTVRENFKTVTNNSLHVVVGNVNQTIREHLETVTNDSSHVMPVANFSELAVVIKEKLMKAIKCAYEEVCYLDSVGKCAWEARRPNDTEICCTNEPPKGGLNCDPQKCKATCDQWQWTLDSNCDQKMPGETIQLQRKGPRPADKKFAHCPETVDFVCNPSTQPTTAKVTSPPAVSTQVPVEPTSAPSWGTCCSNPGVSFGSYLGNEMQCMQSEIMRIWMEKIIVDLLYQAKEAKASGTFDAVKRKVEGCILAVGA